MKGVRSRLGLSLGKKPKETKTSPIDTKLQTSTMPGRSPLGTGLSSRTNLPLVTGSKRGQIPTRDTSRLPTNKALLNPSKEGAGNPLKPNQKTVSKNDYPKSGTNIIQDLLGTQTDSDNPNRINEELRDNPKTATGEFTGDYLSGLTEEMKDLNTKRDDDDGVQVFHGTPDTDKAGYSLDKHGVNIVRSIHVIQDEDEDEENTDKSSSSSSGKHDDFPTNDDKNKTDDPKRSGSPFIEFPDGDKDVPHLDREEDIVYMYPKGTPPSPEVKRVAAESRSRVDVESTERSDDYFCAEDERLSESPELNLNDRSGEVYFNHKLKKGYSDLSKPYNENTSMCVQEPINYDEFKKNRKFDSDFPEAVRSFRSGYDQKPINYGQLSKNRFDSDFPEAVRSYRSGYDREPINYGQLNKNKFDSDFPEAVRSYRSGYDREPINYGQLNKNRFDSDFPEAVRSYRSEYDREPINYSQLNKNKFDSDFSEDVRPYRSGYGREPINYSQLSKNRRFDSDFPEDVRSYRSGYDRKPINHAQLSKNRFDSDFMDDSDSYRLGNKRILSDSEESRKNTYGFGPDNEVPYFDYGPNEESRLPNMQDEPTTLNDQPPTRNKYEHDKTTVTPRNLDGEESMGLYEYEFGGHCQSRRNPSQDFEGFTEERENSPEKISKTDYIEKKVIQRAGAKPVQENLQNSQKSDNSQNSSTDFAKNKDVNKRETLTSQNNNVKDIHSKVDRKDHDDKTDQNILKDKNIYSTLKNEDGSPRQLSIFGRWMVTHGNLVDPQNFCPLAYATQPDQYINLSNYEMDAHGRWLDKNGRYVTPFFYCFGYDGEPVYLGDCDYTNGVHDNYMSANDYNDDFVNNPEKYIDLSDYQMNMDKQWVNSLGRDIDPLSDWYSDGSDDEEYNEYSWMYGRPQFLEDSGLPNSMDGRYPNFCQPDTPYFNDADDRLPMGEAFSETCEYWDFAEQYGCMENGIESMQHPWQAAGDFSRGYTGTNEEYFVEEPDSVPYQQRSSKDSDK